jgi:hypothetical protein
MFLPVDSSCRTFLLLDGNSDYIASGIAAYILNDYFQDSLSTVQLHLSRFKRRIGRKNLLRKNWTAAVNHQHAIICVYGFK